MECASDATSPNIIQQLAVGNKTDDLDLGKISQQEILKLSSPDIDLVSDLVASGPEGVSAAAAIVSMRRHKVHHNFQTDPILRRRKKTELLRKLCRTIQQYNFNQGGQLVLITVSPKINELNIFGTSRLSKMIMGMKKDIIGEFSTALNEESFLRSGLKTRTPSPLPLLTVDGLPTTLDKMNQSQLRCFIPYMIKCSTKRKSIGWGHESTKPVWWPSDLPWISIRIDRRSQSEKEAKPWTHVLRQIVFNCYQHHGKEHYLYSFGGKTQEQSDSSSNSTSGTNILTEAIKILTDEVDENTLNLENRSQTCTIEFGKHSGCDTNTSCCVEEVLPSNKIIIPSHAVNTSCNQISCATTVNLSNSLTHNADTTSSINRFTNGVEYIIDNSSLVSVDNNNAIFLDLRGCVGGYVTYIIPLVQVESVATEEGDFPETFAFAQTNVSTHSLVIQVNNQNHFFNPTTPI